MKPRFPGFKQAMAMMRNRRDAQLMEEGFQWLLPHAGEFLAELTEEFDKPENVQLRRWILELIGSSKSPSAFPFLAQHLHGDDQRLWFWSMWGLKQIDTKEARTLFWQARSFELDSPEKTAAFRTELESVLSNEP